MLLGGGRQDFIIMLFLSLVVDLGDEDVDIEDGDGTNVSIIGHDLHMWHIAHNVRANYVQQTTGITVFITYKHIMLIMYPMLIYKNM